MLSQQVIDDLKAKHGDELTKIVIGEHVIVVRPPSLAEYRRCMDKAADGERKRVLALEELGAQCAVYPEASKVQDILVRKPGIALTLGGKALELCGLADADASKL